MHTAFWTILLTVCQTAVSDQPNGAVPNVLMIAIDDQNDWIGCLGDTHRPARRTLIVSRLGGRFSQTPTANRPCVILLDRVC
jgi:hypothetical protein